jgi:pimeloyl-ACP methyl ester carboxylesterase
MRRLFHSATKLALVVVSFVLVEQAHGQEAPTPRAGDVRIEKREYKTWSGKTGEYEVGTFFVRENRSDPESRVIGIGFSRFPAKGRKGPPIFFLPGGPGNSFLEHGDDPQLRTTPFYVEYLWDSCDVICVDQRGYSRRGEVLRGFYNGSAPKPDSSLDDRIAEYKHLAESVTKTYSKTKTDLRGYTVLECVEDVNELRQALGYGRIVLRGQSFGCQWSFAVMRQHPEIVEHALLSGVEPLDHGYDMPSHIFAAVKRMWKVVDKDPRFAPYLPPGGMAEAAETVIKRLEEKPIEVSANSLLGVGKPTVGRVIGPDDFPWDNPAWILELYHGHTKRWAQTRDRMRGTNTLIHPLIDSSLGVTPERREKLWNDPAVRYLSRRNFAMFLATADIWPSADVGDEFRKPVRCDIPVVFVNGDWDRNTPVENMHEIAPFFPNSHSMVVHQAGHGTINSAMLKQHPKVMSRLMEFLRTGSMDGLPNSIEFQPSRKFDPPTFKLSDVDR